MNRALFALAIAGWVSLPFSSANAANSETLSGKPSAAETPFVQRVTADLNKRFPTPADAEKAGYFRYNNEDETGAISYANLNWDSSGGQPSQLWYDVNGKLLGADYSIPISVTSVPPRPVLWGVDPQRWVEVTHEHVHYVLKMPDGTMKYGLAVNAKTFESAGGNIRNPSASTLVKLGKVQNAADVVKIFTFPAQWDLELWVTPNPNGAFAQTNPLVHPGKNAGSGEM
ncbi:MAG TPA: hypothetical protein VGZ02_00760 [Candidatus Baltobacteraceae bacterium]|jgi:hypothetical protein|nr:hypothetical protein [Candidatus Baltobacteraceae bacterium]